jgi:hypothetical protein
MASRLRDFVDRAADAVEFVWGHLRANWTDALLAAGFAAVILLSAYVLLKS